MSDDSVSVESDDTKKEALQRRHDTAATTANNGDFVTHGENSASTVALEANNVATMNISSAIVDSSLGSVSSWCRFFMTLSVHVTIKRRFLS